MKSGRSRSILITRGRNVITTPVTPVTISPFDILSPVVDSASTCRMQRRVCARSIYDANSLFRTGTSQIAEATMRSKISARPMRRMIRAWFKWTEATIIGHWPISQCRMEASAGPQCQASATASGPAENSSHAVCVATLPGSKLRSDAADEPIVPEPTHIVRNDSRNIRPSTHIPAPEHTP